MINSYAGHKPCYLLIIRMRIKQTYRNGVLMKVEYYPYFTSEEEQEANERLKGTKIERFIKNLTL